MFDAFHLARLQFGFTGAFHITFPVFSIGLASLAVSSKSSRPPRPCGSGSFAYLLPALLFPAGCSQSPSQNILGSFFPAWILCSAIGIAVALLCRVLLGAARLHPYVLAPPFAYLAVAVAVTLFTWLIWFGQ